jgi:hypothetical protein
MLDWDDLRFFLAIARTGSLSAAARELRCTQSTVGRRLAALEARRGLRLLNRPPRGYIATSAGESVRNHAYRPTGPRAARPEDRLRPVPRATIGPCLPHGTSPWADGPREDRLGRSPSGRSALQTANFGSKINGKWNFIF